MTLQEFLIEIAGAGGATGALSYPVARWLFNQVEIPSSANKRWIAYVISFGLAGLAWLGLWGFGYAEPTPDGIFASMVTAFSTSQALHGAFELTGAK